MNRKELILTQVEKFKEMQSWNIEKLAKMLGIDLYLSDMSTEEELKMKSMMTNLHFHQTNAREIILNNCYDMVSKKFSIAYHLAEYILFEREYTTLMVDEKYDSEVYDYAVDLLVPDNYDFQGNIEETTAKYYVAPDVILRKKQLLLEKCGKKAKTKLLANKF